MNSVASFLRESPEFTGEMDNYLTNIDEHVYGYNDQLEYTTLGTVNSFSFDPVFLENGLQLSFDGSCYSDYSGSVYSCSCYGTNDSNLYPDITNTLYSTNSYSSKSETDFSKYNIEHKYNIDNKYSLENKFSMESKYSMENTDILSHNNTPSMHYMTPKLNPKFDYQVNQITTNTTNNNSNISSNINTNINTNNNTMSGINAPIGTSIVDILSPPRQQQPKKVSTQDLALFNSLMDGNPLTPIRNSNNNSVNTSKVTLRKSNSVNTINTAPTVNYNDVNYQQLYYYEEKQTGSPYSRHSSNSTQNSYKYENEYDKNIDPMLSYQSDRNVSTTPSPVQDVYSSTERSINNYQSNNYHYHNTTQDVDNINDNYYTPTTVTTNVVTTYTIPSFDPSILPEERYKEILKTILKMPSQPETFLSPINSQTLKSYSITELANKYDDSQRQVSPSETHVVFVRNNTDLNLILRNDNLLVQHQQTKDSRNEKLKLTKQVLSSKNVANSSDLNECIARSRNDEQGMSYLPFVSVNWKGIHETSWWMSDDKGIVRNFNVKFDPIIFGSKTIAYEEANKFAKYVEGLIRPGTLINWYPGFNIPIGTSGRANLRKVLHMDRMKNAELCDPVLEANGLKVAAKSTFGDMIIVELYKAAYVLGLWDVAAYNCLKTCKRRGYSFEWIHDIQSSGKRITLDALKYMRNVKEMIEQDKLSRVNSEKKRRRRVPDKRRKGT